MQDGGREVFDGNVMLHFWGVVGRCCVGSMQLRLQSLDMAIAIMRFFRMSFIFHAITLSTATFSDRSFRETPPNIKYLT